MAAKVSVGDLLNPMEKIAKALESTEKKVDNISIAIGGSTTDTITALTSINNTLIDLVTYLKNNKKVEKAKKLVESKDSGGGDQGKLKNAIEMFKALGCGIKDLGQGLFLFLIIPEKTGEKVKNIVINVLEGLNSVDVSNVGNVITSLTDIGKGLALFGWLLVLAIPSMILGMALMPLLKLFLMELNWVMSSLTTKETDTSKGQFGFISGLLDVGFGLVAFGWLLLLAVPSMILGMALMPLLKLFMMELGWVMKSVTDKETEKGMDNFLKLPKAIALFAITLILVTPLLVVATLGALALWGVTALINLSLKTFRKRNTQKGIKAMLLTGLSIIVFGLSLLAFFLITKSLTEDPLKMLLMFTLIGGTAFLFKVIGDKATEIAKGVLVVALMGLGLLMLSLGLMLIQRTVDSYAQDPIKLLMLVGIIGGLGVVFGVLGLFVAEIAMGAVAMAAVGGGLIVLSLGLMLIQRSVDSYAQDPNKLLILTGLIGGLGVVFGVLGLAIIPITLGSVAIGILSASLLLLAVPLLLITEVIEKVSKIDSPEDALSNVVDSLLNGVKVIVDNGEYLKPSTLAWIVPSILMLTVIVASIGVMAKIMSEVASLKIPTEFDEKGRAKGYVKMSTDDFINAAVNCAAILKIFTMLFETGSHTIETSEGTITFEGIDTAIFDKISFSVVVGVRRLNKIVTSVSKMAKTITDVASLRLPTEFDKDGNPTKYEPMTANDFINASINAATLLSFWVNMFGDSSTTMTLADNSQVKVNPLSLSSLDNISRSVKRKIVRLGEIVGSVGPMADAIKSYARLLIPKIDKNGKLLEGQYDEMTDTDFTMATERIQQILKLVLETVTEPNFVQSLDDLSKRATEKLANVMQSITGVSSVIDVISQLAGGRVPKTYEMQPDGTEKVTEYQNFTDLLGNTTIETNLQKLITMPLNAISRLDEDIIKKAKDKIEDFNNFFKDFSSSMNQSIKMVTDLNNIKSEFGDNFADVFSVVISGVINPILLYQPQDFMRLAILGDKLETFSEGLKKFNKPAKEFTEIDFKTASEQFTVMWTTFDGVLKGVLKKEKESPVLKQIDVLFTRLVILDSRNIWKKTADGIKKISDAINSVDVQKINDYSTLFDAASKLPKDNVAYQKLYDAVEKIHKTLLEQAGSGDQGGSDDKKGASKPPQTSKIDTNAITTAIKNGLASIHTLNINTLNVQNQNPIPS